MTVQVLFRGEIVDPTKGQRNVEILSFGPDKFGVKDGDRLVRPREGTMFTSINAAKTVAGGIIAGAEKRGCITQRIKRVQQSDVATQPVAAPVLNPVVTTDEVAHMRARKKNDEDMQRMLGNQVADAVLRAVKAS